MFGCENLQVELIAITALSSCNFGHCQAALAAEQRRALPKSLYRECNLVSDGAWPVARCHGSDIWCDSWWTEVARDPLISWGSSVNSRCHLVGCASASVNSWTVGRCGWEGATVGNLTRPPRRLPRNSVRRRTAGYLKYLHWMVLGRLGHN